MHFSKTGRSIALVVVLCAAACSDPSNRDLRIAQSRTIATLTIDDPAFDEIRDAEWLDDSVVAVVAGNGTRIAIVRSGRTPKFLGRAGSGPGEFKSVSSLSPFTAETFLAVDPATRRLSSWTHDGDLLADIKLDAAPVAGPWRTVHGAELKISSRDEVIAPLLVVSGAATRQRVHRDSSRRITTACPLCNMSIAPDGSVAIGDGATEYRIRRVDAQGRALAAIVRNDVPPVAVTPFERDSAAAFRAAHCEELRASGISDLAIRQLLSSFPAAKQKGVFVAGGFRHDDKGNLWLQRNVMRGAPGEVDVYAPDGVLQGTVMLPPGFIVKRIRGPFVLGLQVADDERMRIVTLRISAFRYF